MHNAVPTAVYRHLFCDECTCDPGTITAHRSSDRVYDGDRTQIGHFAIDFPHLERDYHNNLVCDCCGLVRSDPFDVVYIPDENKQKPDNSDIGDENEVDVTRYERPYTGKTYYDSVFAAADQKNLDKPKTLASDPMREMPWERTLPTRPRGKATIHRSRDVVWQHCTRTKFSFLARELVRTDPATGRREYFCILCHKNGLGRRAWHYWPKGQRPLGYVEQGVLTAIQAASEERTRIGLNPPSISDVQNYAGGWWPMSPFVGGTGHFVLNGFSYSAVRDAVNDFVRRGMIYLIEDPLTHEKRIL
jgi:hypothetical protein